MESLYQFLMMMPRSQAWLHGSLSNGKNQLNAAAKMEREEGCQLNMHAPARDLKDVPLFHAGAPPRQCLRTAAKKTRAAPRRIIFVQDKPVILPVAYTQRDRSVFGSLAQCRNRLLNSASET